MEKVLCKKFSAYQTWHIVSRQLHAKYEWAEKQQKYQDSKRVNKIPHDNVEQLNCVLKFNYEKLSDLLI